MEYRKIEKLNVAPSLLGFGCMRFPLNEDKTIDREKSQEMLDYAISKGLNYIDTAYPYHDRESEPFLGEALAKYNRTDYFLATKLPIWLIEKPEDVRKYFDEQCSKLKTDYIDFYLIHALNRDRWDIVKRNKVLPMLEELRNEGKIRFIGFSFHDEYPVYEEIINHRDWDFCQIQLNYVDTQIQQGMKGYELAKEKNIPIIIMEPVKGGALASLPGEMTHVLQAERPEWSIPSWAFRYIGSFDNVKVVLSGMSNMEQVKENIKTYTDYQPLNDSEMAALEKVTTIYRSRQMNECTTCGYCMPCPYGVNIPKNFQLWNKGAIYEDVEGSKNDYHQLEDKRKASNCQACGACEPKCPQGIKIIHDLDVIAKTYLK